MAEEKRKHIVYDGGPRPTTEEERAFLGDMEFEVSKMEPSDEAPGQKKFEDRKPLESQSRVPPSSEKSTFDDYRFKQAKSLGRPTAEVRKIKGVAKRNVSAMLKNKISPHELLMMWANGIHVAGVCPTPEMQLSAAIAAAPYYAPKLANVEVKKDVRIRAVISAQPMTQEQWASKYLQSQNASPSSPSLSIDYEVQQQVPMETEVAEVVEIDDDDTL